MGRWVSSRLAETSWCFLVRMSQARGVALLGLPEQSQGLCPKRGSLPKERNKQLTL